jgi:hypothetical protein
LASEAIAQINLNGDACRLLPKAPDRSKLLSNGVRPPKPFRTASSIIICKREKTKVALSTILEPRWAKQKPSQQLEQQAPQQLEQEAPQQPQLKSPLELRSVLGFGMLFLALTLISGVATRLFGTIGFLVIVVVGALASAASSSVEVGAAGLTTAQTREHPLDVGRAAIDLYEAIARPVTYDKGIGGRLGCWPTASAVS